MEAIAKVLVVDDDENIRHLMLDTLESLGYNTIGAQDGVEALTVLESQNVDLVITDVVMPQMNGIDLLKKIKKIWPSLPVLVITGYDFNYTMDQVRDGGADGFLAKPFRIGKIEEMMQNVLGMQAQQITEHIEEVHKILVVDDDTILRDMLVDTLNSLDYQAEGAEDGEKALERLKEREFDLVITDIKMPNLDGIELLKQIKSNHINIPVMMITAYSQAFPVQKALEEGADGYLAKPFRIEKIDELMRQLLSEKQSLETL
jgi:CheY-like chemotaxis protein